MAHTQVTKAYSANNGTANTFSYSGSFDVFLATEVVVLLDNVALTYTASTINESASPREYTVDISAKTVHIGGADLSSGSLILKPVTNVETAKSTFTPGSNVDSSDLNNNQTQVRRKLMEYDAQKLSTTGGTLTGDLTMGEDQTIIFEGATDDAYETTLTVTDPTADRTITIPNVSGTVVTTGDTGTVATAMIADDAIDNDKLANSVVASIAANTSKVTNATHTGEVTGSTTLTIAADAVDGSNIADDSIDSEHYVDGSIDLAHLSSGSVDSTKMTGATVVINSEQSGYSANDTSFYTTAASDARYYNIGSTEEIVSSETWVSDDASIATTKAVDNRVINLVDEVGGFVPIADESDFPSTNPDINSAAGTIVSIGTLTTSYTPSTGTVTIPASTLDNLSNDLTITGCGSTVLASGFGVLVETKALSDSAYAANPSYTFHRLTPKSTEVTTVAGISSNVTTVAGIQANVTAVAGVSANVTTVAGIASGVTTVANNNSNVSTVATNISNVNNFAEKYQIDDFSPSAPTTDGGGNAVAEGDLAYDSTANTLKVYTGSAWESGVTAPSDLITKNTIDAKGDLLTGSADNTVVRTAVGSNGKFLKADSGATGGVSWDTVTQTDTTYAISCVDGDNSDEEKIRLTAGGSGSGTDDVVLEAGTGLSIARSGDKITLTNTVTDTNTQLTQEQVEDFVGGMLDGTETGISVTYDDTDGNIDFVVASQTPEGTAILSTGETGGTKFLREDGDNSCSWQTVTQADTTYAISCVDGDNSDEEKIRLTAGGSGSGTDDIVLEAGTGLSIARSGDKITLTNTVADTTLSLIDEDNMASDSATRPPSQQSVKAYVDSNAGTTINNATANELVTVASTTSQLDAESSLTFQDTATTGLISGRQVTGRGFECPATVSDDWTIAAGNNAMFPGPMTVAATKTVTVPANRTLTIV